MGKTFWIIVFDGFGVGLDFISPRIYEIYDEKRGHRRNSFSYETAADIAEFLQKHQIEERFVHFKVVT